MCWIGLSGNWSLSGLCEHLLGQSIRKEQRLTDWSQKPLTSQQRDYAAVDAFASYELYFEIKANAVDGVQHHTIP